MVEKTGDTSKQMICADDKNTINSNNDVSKRDSDPHWLLNELNEILEKGMFKHD